MKRAAWAKGRGRASALRDVGPRPHAGKGNRRKQTTMVVFADANSPPISPHPVVKVHGYKAQVKIEMRCDCPVEPFGWGEHLLEIHVQV